MTENFIRECEMTKESGLHTDVDVNLKTGTEFLYLYLETGTILKQLKVYY